MQANESVTAHGVDLEETKARPDSTTVLANGMKIVGEAVLPGASLLADGKIVNGLAHAALGFGARVVAGPVGFVLVAADSYSKSVTDKHIWTHLNDAVSGARASYRERRGHIVRATAHDAPEAHADGSFEESAFAADGHEGR